MRAAAIVAITFVLLPAVASADNFALADEHARLAKAHILTGHLGDAIKDYEHAFQASPQPKYIYNVGELHRRLAEAGAIEEMRASREFFTRYLELQPNAPDRRQVEARIIGLQARIESAEAAARETSLMPAKQVGTPPAAVPPVTQTLSDLTNAQDVAATEPAPTKRKKWVWALVGAGGVFVTGAAIGLGVGFGQRRTTEPSTDLGTIGGPQ